MPSAHENRREPNLYHCEDITGIYIGYGGYMRIGRVRKTMTRPRKATVHLPMLPPQIKSFNLRKPKESKDEVPTCQAFKTHSL